MRTFNNIATSGNINSPKDSLKYAVNILGWRKMLILVVFILIGISSNAATYYSRATGNWSSNTTWSLTSGGSAVGTGVFPIAGDAVTIEGGFNVTLTANAACASVTFTTTTATSLTLGTYQLDVSGAITIPRSGSGFNQVIVGAGILNAGSVAFTSGGGTNRHQVTISTGTVTVSGAVTQSGSNGSATIAFTGAGLLKLGGAFLTSATGTLTPSTGTVEYNGVAQTVGDFTYNNLTLSGSGAKTTTGATVNGILSMEGTATTSGTIPTYGSSATLKYNGTGAQTTGTEFPATWSRSGGVIIANTSGNAVTLGAAKTINALLSISAGAKVNLGTGLNSTSTSLSLGGVSQPGDGATYGGTGSAASPINTTYFAASTGMLTVGTACTPGTWLGTTSTDWNTASNWCGGVPTASTNVVIPNVTNKPTIGAAGGLCNNITINSSATLTITGSNTLTVSGNWTNSGTFTRNTSTVIFNGTTQSIGTGPFYNLTISGSGTKTLGVATTANGALTINSGVTLATANNGLTLGGNFVNNGTFTGGSSAITITGTTSQSIGVFTTTGTITVSKNSGTATFTGSTSGGALTFSGTSPEIAINGTLAISGAVTLNNSTTNRAATISGSGALTCASVSIGSNTTTGTGTFTHTYLNNCKFYRFRWLNHYE